MNDPIVGEFYRDCHGLIVEVRSVAVGVCYVTDGERTFTPEEWRDREFTKCN